MTMLIEICSPAPVLNTPDFSFAFGGKTGSNIPLNEGELPYCFEFVALKKRVFRVEESICQKGAEIYRISCPFYPKHQLFLDSRFAKPATSLAPLPPLPPANVILRRMVEMTGAPYVWGGNWRSGIPEMLLYYPSKTPIDDRTSILWTLKGVDCSGLLYEAAEGATPRNTSQLIHFGKALPIDSSLKPLDMLVYPGHVVFIKDETTTIESKFPFGVIQRDLTTRLCEFDAERKRIEEWTDGLNPLKFYTVRRFVERV